MDILSLIIIFLAAAGASAFGALIGGASLITIPTLILLGLPPHTAIGTDRFGVIGIGVAGFFEFNRKKMINYRLSFLLAIPAFLGSLVGANLALSIQENILNAIIILTNVLCLLYIILNPKIGLEGKKRSAKRHEYYYAGPLCFVIGIYGGFYGAMTATFLAYVLIMWFGQTFIQSAANVKVAAVFLTSSAATIFGLKGAIEYSLGTAMLLGCLCGSYLGAHFSDKVGNLWIKRLFVVILTVMILKMASKL